MTNSNYKDGHAHLFSKHVDSINWFSVAIIFKATYARFEREKKLFYSFIQNTSKRFIYQKHALDCVHEHIKTRLRKHSRDLNNLRIVFVD